MTPLAEAEQRPLAGVRVLELGTYVAGPFCATMLAEFGAEVIKLELPGVGDPCRRYGSPSPAPDSSYMFLSEGRNKKSITLDLRTPEGAELTKRLVTKVDIVVENFQPGTLERWGLGWEVLRAVNPRLVMARISAYGQTGPLSEQPGFGRVAIAFGGLGYITGYPDRAPTSPGTATLADYMSGLFAANGVLLALRAREQTGRGQCVDMALYEAVFRILDETAPVYAASGRIRERSGPSSHNSVPHSNYPTTDGRWISIACTNDVIFSRLAAASGHPELAGEGKWGTYRQRRADEDAVNAYVTNWTESHTRAEIQAICKRFEVPCGPIYSIAEIFEDEQYAARGNLLHVEDERAGTVVVPNTVPRLSETPGGVDTLGPALGQHTEEILGGLLGIGPDELAELGAQGVV
ncbi:MAG: CoA transferase [Acidobacteriota bacterium]|nr:CoA transferase [Acidobacteriota bacterium]